MSEENENIENFLRKGLENKEFQFREEDWQKLEARLDTVMPPQPSSGMTTTKWLALSALLITVSFLSGWFLSTRLREGGEATVITVGEKTENEAGKFEDHDNNSSQQVVESQNPTGERLQEGPADSPANENGERRGAGEIEETTPGTSERPGLIVQQGKLTGKGSGTGIEPAASDHAETNPAMPAEVDTQPVFSEDVATRGSLFGTLNGRQPVANGPELPSVPELTPARFGPVYPAEAVLPIAVRPKHKFAVGAAISPDLSSTRLSPNLNEIGKAYGIFLEFQPLSAWRFGTGVFKADKVYTAGKGEYSPPLYSGWPGGVEPSSTEAACDVLDIPLTAGFRLIDGRRVSFWLNGGISSYWMLSEAYNYNYDDYTGYRIKGWWGENENKHPLSVVSLSVSIETFVAENISVRIEPFFKAPFAGVGYGKVNLYTTGSFFALRYHFPNRKKRQSNAKP